MSGNVINGFEQAGSGGNNVLRLNDKATPNAITFAAAAGGANVSEITLTVNDAEGVAYAGPTTLLIWLSDVATGVGLTSTSASGTVTAKSASGEDFGAITAKKALFGQTLADSTFILEITDTAKTTFFVCAQNPLTGETFVSDQLETADYGS